MKLAVSDKSAAEMLDLRPKQFHALVSAGALPPPTRIGDVERWRVDDLQAIVSGKAAMPDEDLEI